MNNVAVKKWIDALRSGDYEKCTGHLRLDDTYCVMGVLCDVHSKEKQAKCKWAEYNPEYLANTDYPQIYKYCGDDVVAPPEVEDWIGRDFITLLSSEKADVITANDQGLDFNDLSNMIEKHAKELGYE